MRSAAHVSMGFLVAFSAGAGGVACVSEADPRSQLVVIVDTDALTVEQGAADAALSL